jgi:hypothetical protein
MSTSKLCTTELAIFQLKADVDINKEGSDGEKVVQSMFEILAEQPGYKAGCYGIHDEHTENVTFALGMSEFYHSDIEYSNEPLSDSTSVDWASIQDDKNFEQTPAFQPFLENIGTIIAGPPKIFHVNFRHPFQVVSEAAVVEMATIYLPIDFDQTAFEKIWDALVKSLSTADGFCASTSGWVIEELENDKVEEKTRAWVGAIGWASVEAHNDVKGKHPAVQGVRDSVLPGTEMHHVRFTRAAV